MMRKTLTAIAWAALIVAVQGGEAPVSLKLGQRLFRDARYDAAAVEFLRASLEATNNVVSTGSRLKASYAYFRAGEFDSALSLMEAMAPGDEDKTEHRTAWAVLSSECLLGRGEYDAAGYFLDLVPEASAPARVFSTRRRAEIAFRNSDYDTAAALLQAAEHEAARAAVQSYAAGSDKSPLVGGLLGLVPGLGYVYSGEWENGLRSMLLNGLFLYAMADTADEEQWGAFAALTFFEVTWYSGSIYGGIDAAHRYNADRADAAIEAIRGDLSLTPGNLELPLFELRITF